MRRTTYRLAAVAAAAALSLSACGDAAGEPAETADTEAGGADQADDDAAPDNGGGTGEAAAGGEYDSFTIGIKYDQPGLGLMEGDTPSGFDVDVAKAVAEKLGVSEDSITWMEAPTPQRETLLESGQVDMIFATYSITDERKQRVQFAGPYLVAGQDLLVRADDDTINGPDDLEGKNLCSVAGSTPAERVSENYPGVELQEYDTYSLCVEALASGAVDALTTDDTILAGYASQDTWSGQFRVVGQPFSEELYGVGIPQDDTELCQQVNDALTELYDDGSMDTIISDNFGPADYTPAAGTNPPEVGGHCAD